MTSRIPPNIKNLIVDMDGVLWHGDRPMPGLVQFFDALRAKQINFVLATNNATKTAVMYTEKLAQFGVTLNPDRILTSAEATASYLRERHPAGTAVYVLGAKGLHDAHIAQGFEIVSPEQVRRGAAADVVVGGLDLDATYEDLAMAALLVRRGAPFVATNLDVTFPSELGPLPGAGAILSVITASTGVEPLSIGKPGPILFDKALERLGGTVENTAMVGDRLGTDIAGGNAAGLYTILVLTGVSTLDDVESGTIKPDAILKDITEVASKLV